MYHIINGVSEADGPGSGSNVAPLLCLHLCADCEKFRCEKFRINLEIWILSDYGLVSIVQIVSLSAIKRLMRSGYVIRVTDYEIEDPFFKAWIIKSDM